MTVNDSLDPGHVDSTRPEEVDAALMRLWTPKQLAPTEGVCAAYEVLGPVFDDRAEGA